MLTRAIEKPRRSGVFLCRSVSRRLDTPSAVGPAGPARKRRPRVQRLSDFLIYCRVERRLGDLTCKAYERDVRVCIEFLRGQGISALAEVRTADLRRYLADQATSRPAPSSQARTVAAPRCFFRFCVESDYLERDPVHVLRTPKKREALPDVLNRGELSRLLAHPVGDFLAKRVALPSPRGGVRGLVADAS